MDQARVHWLKEGSETDSIAVSRYRQVGLYQAVNVLSGSAIGCNVGHSVAVTKFRCLYLPYVALNFLQQGLGLLPRNVYLERARVSRSRFVGPISVRGFGGIA